MEANDGTPAPPGARPGPGFNKKKEEHLNKVREVFKDSKTRFVLELEFVSLLANPRYLQHLALNRYFDDPAFINYLDYLQYWQRPGYIKYLTHPHCLYFLELLQRPEFRRQLLDANYVNNYIWTNQYFHWRGFRYLRWKEHSEKMEMMDAKEQNEKEELEAKPEALGQPSQGISGQHPSLHPQQQPQHPQHPHHHPQHQHPQQPPPLPAAGHPA